MRTKWEQIEQRYRQRHQAGKPGWTNDYSNTAQEIQDFLVRNGMSPGGRFLELGCGAGNRTLLAAQQGFSAFGVDLAREAIFWASEAARKADIQADFRVGDIVSLDGYPANFFHVVFDGGVLYMLTDGKARRECFRNIVRVLKPGGVLYATAHLVKSDFGRRHELAPNCWYDPAGRFTTLEGEPAYYFSKDDEFRGEIEGAGLDLLRLEKVAKEDAEYPFSAGEMWADARKPKTGMPRDIPVG